MSSSSVSTRENLLSIIDDMELLCRELVENVVSVKTKRLSRVDHSELSRLLLLKEEELRQMLAVAARQEQTESVMEQVRQESRRQDQDIQQLQKQLKEAETLLSTSIFQAKQKLSAIEKAKEMPVPAEELIKYGHRISASNAVSAPLNWQQGDPRRPYPTDMEMRLGFLGRPDAERVPPTSSHAGIRSGSATPAYPGQPGGSGGAVSAGDFLQHPMASPFQHHLSSPSKMPSGGGGHTTPSGAGASGTGGQFSWQGGEMGMTMKDGTHIPISDVGPAADGQAGPSKEEQVEMMSADSSSSSSTDSN